MSRTLGVVAVVVCGLALCVPALGQFVYPHGLMGWGGWGAATVAGDTAAGMGMFAAGAGAYNLHTAQADAINAQTIMSLNEYLYQSQQNANANYYKRLEARQQQLNQNRDAIYRRLRDNPNATDISSGNALNVVFDELKAPKVWPRVLRAAGQSVESKLVKNIPFQHAASAITISLVELSARGVPAALSTNPAFQDDLKALRAVAEKEQAETSDGRPVPEETLQQARVVLKAMQAKVAERLERGSRARREADNFVKALYGLTKMLEFPRVGLFLKDLDRIPTTDLAHLLAFMHSFNLRFGATTTPVQSAAYTHIYPELVTLRDKVLTPQDPSTAPAEAPMEPKKVISFFSALDYDDFATQPAPEPGA
jgi:hypothetical protein